ncbi:MAG: hypothetical protein ACUVQ5_03225 [Candidatus Methanomethylicaceae archaeon]
MSVKCLSCGREFSSKPLKSWKFRFYDVKRYERQHCKMKFNIYDSPKSKFVIVGKRASDCKMNGKALADAVMASLNLLLEDLQYIFSVKEIALDEIDNVLQKLKSEEVIWLSAR